MKKSIIILTAIISAASFTGCMKKGEGDPGISLHTRKARVTGEWKVSAGSGTQVSSGATTTWTYAEPTYTQTDASGTSTSNITLTYTFEKDGKWKSVQTSTGTILSMNYTDVVTETGTWNFTAGVGDGKKKTQLVLIKDNSTDVYTLGSSSPTTTTDTYTGVAAPTDIFDLFELKNKEMIIKWDSSTSDASGTSTDKGEWTMVQ